MIDNGLHILADDARPGHDAPLADPLDPDLLAATHPLWAADVARFGPFERRDGLFDAPSTADWPAPVVVCGACPSALDVAWALRRRDELPEWGAVLALTQRRGRGQVRRHWESPPGNVHLAWSWPWPGKALDPLVPLMVGLVVAETLESLGLETSLKWPNDVLVDGRKVCGILVEERGGALMAGVGVNLAQAPPDAALREDRAVAAASLEGRLDNDPGPAALCATLVFRGVSCYKRQLSSLRPEAIIPALERRLAWKGNPVMVHGSGQPYQARIIGLSANGGLLLDRNGRREPLFSGSVSQISSSADPAPRGA